MYTEINPDENYKETAEGCEDIEEEFDDEEEKCDIFIPEEDWNIAFSAGWEKGYSAGQKNGYEVGYDEGQDSGYEDGYEIGYECGKEDGFCEAAGEKFDEGYTTGYAKGKEDGANESINKKCDGNIYVIRVAERLDLNYLGWPDMGTTEVVGFYWTEDDAISAVKDNCCDIWETCYDYAIVERVGVGLYECATEEDRWFYQYDAETGNYFQIDAPIGYQNVGGLTIL